MMHDKRTWRVHTLEFPEQLPEKLYDHSWTSCTAFTVRGHENVLFLNDQTSPDGAGEWAILYKGLDGHEGWTQVESITFSWCDRAKTEAYVAQALAGKMRGMRLPVDPRIDESTRHECAACA